MLFFGEGVETSRHCGIILLNGPYIEKRLCEFENFVKKFWKIFLTLKVLNANIT